MIPGAILWRLLNWLAGHKINELFAYPQFDP